MRKRFTETFESTGYFPNRSLFSPGVTLTGVMFQDRFVVNAYYNADFMRKYRDQSVGGQIGFRF